MGTCASSPEEKTEVVQEKDKEIQELKDKVSEYEQEVQLLKKRVSELAPYAATVAELEPFVAKVGELEPQVAKVADLERLVTQLTARADRLQPYEVEVERLRQENATLIQYSPG